MAIRRRRIQHGDLIESGSKPQTGAFRKEEDVVLMPIRVSNEPAEGIEPSKSPRVFIGQSPVISE